jgi:hypothetical protein
MPAVSPSTGQNDGEASLSVTCASGNYKYVILAFVYMFGKEQTPQLDLASHCDPSSGGCRGLSKDIRWCQNKGVKVLLSISGGDGSYGPFVGGRRAAGGRVPLKQLPRRHVVVPPSRRRRA